MTLRRTLHDESHNETWYYESERGNIWHEVDYDEIMESLKECEEEEDEGEDS